MKQVAIVGIQGVPAKYGGFETLVENIIGDNCCPEVRYTVFCSGKDYATRMKTYKGARYSMPMGCKELLMISCQCLDVCEVMIP